MAMATDKSWYVCIGGQEEWVLVDSRAKLADIRVSRNGGSGFDDCLTFESPNDFEKMLDDAVKTSVSPAQATAPTVIPDGCGLVDENGFVDTGVYLGKLWGVAFLDSDDEQVGDILWFGIDNEGIEAVDLHFANSENDELTGSDWPDEAVRISDVSKDVFRHPVHGIDYGTGSVRHRFGGIRPPRKTYQYSNQ